MASTFGRKPLHKVTLGEYGDHWLKRMSYAMAKEAFRKFQATKDDPDAAYESQCWFVAKTLCDESGKLTAEDESVLAECDVEFVTLLADEVIKINGLNRGAAAEMGKGLPPTTTGDSSSA